MADAASCGVDAAAVGQIDDQLRIVTDDIPGTERTCIKKYPDRRSLRIVRKSRCCPTDDHLVGEAASVGGVPRKIDGYSSLLVLVRNILRDDKRRGESSLANRVISLVNNRSRFDECD